MGARIVSALVPNGRADVSGSSRRHKFPRSVRLLRHADFERVYKQGRRHFAAHITVFYLPRRDVKMERLVPTTHRTHCPFKGDASYFTLSNGRTSENAVWSYEQPYDEVSLIKDRLAFYPDRVDSITGR